MEKVPSLGVGRNGDRLQSFSLATKFSPFWDNVGEWGNIEVRGIWGRK